MMYRDCINGFLFYVFLLWLIVNHALILQCVSPRVRRAAFATVLTPNLRHNAFSSVKARLVTIVLSSFRMDAVSMSVNGNINVEGV